MSVRKIEIGCDTPACWAHCSISATTIDAARAHAAERYGWTRRDGSDICAPCERGDTPQARGEA
ncbi:hypothetical protein [Spirillospora sp. NBC_01491]|uniref:hypothetical protein n=1 Tax=Spirillospora sp. NBC_01491 TaxID=2976007 RepID=UPI002E2F3571|nr:hypothetical protein [Spirillospora sp. NBC_01491]